jgi:acyl-CoA synthetase (NDP forming)
LETVKLLSVWQGAKGRRTVFFTTSGGDAGLAADHSDAAGLVLPQPTPAQAADLRAILPSYGTVSNPLDFTAPLWGQEEPLAKLFAVTMRENCDQAVLVIDNPIRDPDGHPGVHAMVRALDTAKAETRVAAAMATTNPESFPETLRLDVLARGMAPMQGAHDAIRAIAGAAAFTEARARLAHMAPAPDVVAPLDVSRALLWSEADGKAALKAFGVPVPEGRVVDELHVGEAARALGFPVVVKAASAEIPHKTEAGAVALGIADADGAVRAAAQIRENVQSRSNLAVSRFLVERMAPKPVAELIVGITRDPQFGLSLVVGAGGVLVELVRASVSLLLPTTRAEVMEALARGPVGRLLAGYRGGPKGDVAAAADAILSVARFAQANAHRLVELDVNPLFVLPQGVVAVDALVRAAD